MLTVEEALERILGQVVRLPSESVSLDQGHDRILAEDIVSPRDVPPWDNSAMDGYALCSADTGEGEVGLTLNEVIAAGAMPTCRVERGTASAIMTGAPMPEGADAVVMVERTDGARQGRVQVSGRVHPGDHIRPQAQDIATGQTILRAGDRLTAGAVGLVASLGLTDVRVAKQPVVAILSTGDEVVMPGKPLQKGQIYSSNSFALAALVRDAGGIPRDMGNAPDDLDVLVARLEAGLDADVVCTTGGVSVGAYDFVKEAYHRLGVDMGFWKVRMKPGKPLAFGRVDRHGRTVPLFGLPGNPVSCMVNFLQYVRPWMQLAMGNPRPFLPVLEATAGETIREKPGRAKLIRVVLEQGEHGWICRSTGLQSSGVLMSMARAHGLLLLSADSGTVEAGQRVRVQLLNGECMQRPDPGYGW